MKNKLIFSLLILTALVINASAQVPAVAPAQKKPVMLVGGTIHTGTGQVIENGLIAFTSGKISWVGKASESKIDKSGYEIIDITGKQVYPGLIFPSTSLGLTEIGSGVDVANDTRELGDLNPDVRAIAAYNTDSHVIPVIRSNGILIAQIVPQGTLLPGTSSVVQLDAWNWKDAAYRMDNGLLLGWPRRSAAAGRQGAAMQAMMGQATTSSYDRNVEMLEKIFSDAVAYAALEKPENTNLRLEAMKGLFDGSKTLFVSSTEAKGIIAAISFAKRYGVKKIVLAGAGETAWMVKDFLKENNIPVILNNPLSLPATDESDIRLPLNLLPCSVRRVYLLVLPIQPRPMETFLLLQVRQLLTD